MGFCTERNDIFYRRELHRPATEPVRDIRPISHATVLAVPPDFGDQPAEITDLSLHADLPGIGKLSTSAAQNPRGIVGLLDFEPEFRSRVYVPLVGVECDRQP